MRRQSEQSKGPALRGQNGGARPWLVAFWHGWHPWQRQHLSHDVRRGDARGHCGQAYLQRLYRHRVVIGKDTRLSGYMIESALVSGLPPWAWTCSSSARCRRRPSPC